MQALIMKLRFMLLALSALILLSSSQAHTMFHGSKPAQSDGISHSGIALIAIGSLAIGFAATYAITKKIMDRNNRTRSRANKT